jgi:hypothetical protein
MTVAYDVWCPVCKEFIHPDSDRYWLIGKQFYHRDCLREAVRLMQEEFPDE